MIVPMLPILQITNDSFVKSNFEKKIYLEIRKISLFNKISSEHPLIEFHVQFTTVLFKTIYRQK